MDRKQGIDVNYLYFGLFFILLILTSGSSIFIKEHFNGSRIFFFLYAAGQAALETLLLVFIGYIAHRFLGKIVTWTFIGATFLFLIFHLLDFFMNRILDLSIWETLDFVFDETFENFIYLLDASGIPLWVWAIGFILLASLPLLGIALNKWTKHLIQTKPLHLRYEWVLQAFICIPIALLFWEFTASRLIHPDSYTSFVKSLPWKWTFLQPHTVSFSLPNTPRLPLPENVVEEKLKQDTTVLHQKPNIYLFVIESLREDMITEAIAPGLYHFKQHAIHSPSAFSNANGSHLSWFSIFHSQFPYCWQHVQSTGWKMGSPALQLLKQWGYKIRLYTSAQLNYYGMEELLFGKDHHLIDSYQTFHHAPPKSAAESDTQAIAALQHDLSSDANLREGQCCIIFLDGTHFNYSWPENWNPKFTPFSQSVDYFHFFETSAKIEKIKNRYRNAVCYVDSLFTAFYNQLSDPHSIVIVTGDHGEEFFEHGNLFHGSHLTCEQIHVPIYIKLGIRDPLPSPALFSQMEIFPTLLHHLSGHAPSFLEGASLLAPPERPYTLTARFNAGRAPYEFCIHNGQHKFIARFDNRRDIFRSKKLCIRSLWDCADQCLVNCPTDTTEWVETEFGPFLQRLFY